MPEPSTAFSGNLVSERKTLQENIPDQLLSPKASPGGLLWSKYVAMQIDSDVEEEHIWTVESDRRHARSQRKASRRHETIHPIQPKQTETDGDLCQEWARPKEDYKMPVPPL